MLTHFEHFVHSKLPKLPKLLTLSKLHKFPKLPKLPTLPNYPPTYRADLIHVLPKFICNHHRNTFEIGTIYRKQMLAQNAFTC